MSPPTDGKIEIYASDFRRWRAAPYRGDWSVGEERGTEHAPTVLGHPEDAPGRVIRLPMGARPGPWRE